jgi:type VI secretion system secreted protein Hcp
MAVDYFLKLDGVPGESRDSKHTAEIDVMSFSWGESNASSAVGSGAGAGKVQMQDFHFTMDFNVASPKLMLSCATGDHIKTAVLTCRRAGKEQQDYLKITFTECFVTSYQLGGSGGQVVPMDQISINYAKMEMEYLQQQADGTVAKPVKVGYDIKANKKV